MGWTLYQANFFIATKTTRYVVEKYSNDLVAKIPPNLWKYILCQKMEQTT